MREKEREGGREERIQSKCRNRWERSRWQSLTFGGTRDPAAGCCEMGLEPERTGHKQTYQERSMGGKPRPEACSGREPFLQGWGRVSPVSAREQMAHDVSAKWQRQHTQPHAVSVPGAYLPTCVSQATESIPLDGKEFSFKGPFPLEDIGFVISCPFK